MLFRALHRWDLSPKEAISLQNKLSKQVVLHQTELSSIKYVAGVDVSYKRNGNMFHAAITLLNYHSMQTVDSASASGEVNFPYVPGLLSFRELPVLLEAFANLSIIPDIVLADAQGIAHPRRLGLASHLGLWLDLPTIGCAKSRLCGEHLEPELTKGSWAPLLDDGEEIGRVLRTRDKVKPLFISPGHKINFEDAAEVVIHCCRGYRLPEPTRQAHLLSNRIRAEYEVQDQ